MSTRAPRKAAILVMALFAASCIALAVYLWLSFGGSVPLASSGYRITVEFDQAVQLGSQADVEIAGVPVGKVLSVGLDRRSGLSRAVLRIDARYAPRPANTRAQLRTKTLLGETYVALTLGNVKGPMLRSGARLPRAQVDSTVQLDQILNTFDPRTRAAFQTWMRDDGIALTGRGQDLNDALAQLAPFATNVGNVLTVLRRDGAATSTLLADGAKVLDAISRNPGQLQGLVRNANRVFGTTAQRDTELAAAVKDFPQFLSGTRRTVASVRTFAEQTDPLVKQLTPAARQLSPALESLAKLTPSLQTVLTELGPLTSAAATGIPALERFLAVDGSSDGAAKTLFESLTPYLGELVPVIDYLNAYRKELAAFFANGTAATEAQAPGFSTTKTLHYIRVSAPLSPDELTAQTQRSAINRANAYEVPGGGKALTGTTNALGTSLDVFGTYLCNAPEQYPLPAIPSAPDSVRYQSELPLFYGGEDASTVPAPACTAQQRLSDALSGALGAGLGSGSGFYPQLQPLP